jgi:hypothetical protein
MAWMDRVIPDALALGFCIVGLVALWFSDWKGSRSSSR